MKKSEETSLSSLAMVALIVAIILLNVRLHIIQARYDRALEREADLARMIEGFVGEVDHSPIQNPTSTQPSITTFEVKTHGGSSSSVVFTTVGAEGSNTSMDTIQLDVAGGEHIKVTCADTMCRYTSYDEQGRIKAQRDVPRSPKK